MHANHIKANDILRAAGARLIRENTVKDGRVAFATLQWWATQQGCIVVQLMPDGGVMHYCEGGAKWADLEADAARMCSMLEAA